MLIQNRWVYRISIVIMVGFFSYFFYAFVKSFFFVKDHHLQTSAGLYINRVSLDESTQQLAQKLTKHCKTKECEIQTLLDYVTTIPYKINPYVSKKPTDVVENNFGDCDDKSNLLISLLKAKNIESYFVLVPKHIFVIVKLDKILPKKGIYLNNQKYYILETTAEGSKIGFPLKYRLNEIEEIIDPFENRKIKIENIRYGI